MVIVPESVTDTSLVCACMPYSFIVRQRDELSVMLRVPKMQDRELIEFYCIGYATTSLN